MDVIYSFYTVPSRYTVTPELQRETSLGSIYTLFFLMEWTELVKQYSNCLMFACIICQVILKHVSELLALGLGTLT